MLLKRNREIKALSEEDIGSREGWFIFIRLEILFYDGFMLMAMSQYRVSIKKEEREDNSRNKVLGWV